MTDFQWDSIWLNVNLATMATAAGTGPAEENLEGGKAAPYGEIREGALAVQQGKIAWIGAQKDLPGDPKLLAKEVCDGNGAWMTPGLIDCHTHLVYGGNRAREFELRLEGASYEEIARAGGGIRSTVRETRRASEDELLVGALKRLDRLREEGVTTVEIKSGYGLTVEDEAKMLRVAREVGEQRPVSVRTTFLGAHAVPEEYDGRADDYIDLVIEEMLPKVIEEGLVDAVDAFCEGIGFSREQTERVFLAAQKHGLPLKLHAEQLSDLKGAQLAAEYGALSADHLEYLEEDGVKAMAEHGTVAVLLPGAFYFLRETKLPPMDLLRGHGVPIAIATDSNPGSSPAVSLLLMLNMACTLFRMTPEEALAGVTRNAAGALGLQDSHGTLEVGKAADLVLWDIDSPADLAYGIGANPRLSVIKEGRIELAQ